MYNQQKGNLEGPRIRDGIAYNDGELTLIKNILEIRNFLPCQLKIFVIVLVDDGKATIRINGTLYEAHKNDLFICTPNNIVDNALMSLDFKGTSIWISSSYMQRIFPMIENSWSIKLFWEKNPKYILKPEEVSIFSQYFDLLYSKIQQPFSTQKKVIDSLMVAFAYDMQRIQDRLIQQKIYQFTAGESLFNRFIKLLESSYPKQRSVSYYADRLFVSAKYLSCVCFQVSGQRPTAIINKYVLKDIDYLMKHTQLSMKEIANELKLSNLSFFGKYIKKHKGMPPRSYREAAIKEEAL